MIDLTFESREKFDVALYGDVEVCRVFNNDILDEPCIESFEHISLSKSHLKQIVDYMNSHELPDDYGEAKVNGNN